MSRLRPIVAILLLLLAPVSLLARSDAPAHGLQYEELLTGGASASEPLPLVIAIHGLGDRPENFAGLFRDLPCKARVVLPRAPIPWGSGGSWFEPKPTPRAEAELVDSADRLAALARAIADEKPTLGKPIVTGFSQGGILSFVLAVRHPEAFSAAVPVAGQLPKPFRPTGKAPRDAPPIRALHGAADTRIATRSARESVDLLKRGGWDATLTTFEGVGHRIPPAVRTDLHGALRDAAAKAARSAAK